MIRIILIGSTRLSDLGRTHSSMCIKIVAAGTRCRVSGRLLSPAKTCLNLADCVHNVHHQLNLPNSTFVDFHRPLGCMDSVLR